MAKKKWLLLVPAVLLVQALAAADWKNEVAVRMAREADCPQLIESLQQQFPQLPEKEKAAVSLIIGYCQSRSGSPQAELFWMNKYLGEYRALAVNLAFLPPAVRQKVQKFRQSWQKDFPVLWELALAPEDAEAAFFTPPADLKLRLQSSLPCEYQLLARDGAPLAKGVLGAGIEMVKVPLGADFLRTASHSFRLLLSPRNAPEKTVEKYFAVELEYAVPDDAEFDPQSGTLKLKGREPRPEQETETRVISQSRRFDKALFKKTVLKDLLIGAAFFGINATLVTSTIDSPDSSLVAKSSLFGTRRVFTLAGIGFSLSALSKLPKVFKRDRVVEEKTRELPEARAANQQLERDLAQARRQVRVKLAVKAIE
ncbi:MAG: hypothetical protein MUC72_07645 [Acidobacteria bacterium]|jgi:hypothetical protein|nr:hypothetical protein [Acidobacteriota bacterium]